MIAKLMSAMGGKQTLRTAVGTFPCVLRWGAIAGIFSQAPVTERHRACSRLEGSIIIMDRYFFDFDNGRASRDEEGTEFLDLKGARLAAVQMLGQLLCDRNASFWDEPEFGLTVRDDADLILMRLTVIGTLAPATQ